MSASNGSKSSVAQIANRYFESVGNEFNESQEAEFKQSVQDGEERYEQLVEEHGKNHNLTKKARRVIEVRRNKLGDLEEAEERIGIARDEFLSKVADEFEFSEEWLETDVVNAVTHALYNKCEANIEHSARRYESSTTCLILTNWSDLNWLRW